MAYPSIRRNSPRGQQLNGCFTHTSAGTSAVRRGPPAHLIRRRDVRVRFIESIYKNIPHIGDV
jgi:hypothetical protein